MNSHRPVFMSFCDPAPAKTYHWNSSGGEKKGNKEGVKSTRDPDALSGVLLGG
jgi:hypothetical protein